MMKIVTYNVNGLRQRISQFGSLRKLLDSFDADIICFQETKLRRQELKSDLVLAEGYESFFSCTRTSDKGRTGYSGVATFCRVNSAFSSNEVALPVAAEEGFTGVLDASGSKIVEGLEEFAKDELCKVDGEGRCIITDHGHFILFNIYGPRAGSDDVDRIQFKHKFFKILQKRWEFLLCQKRRIFVVGDLNIAPAAIDRCEAEPDFEENEFRRWFRSLLVESGGPFFDVFRAKHPERRDAYTCWPSNTGAEQFNYGTRIDHILCGGPCLHEKHDLEGHNFVTCHVKECDILVEYKRWKPGNTLGTRWKGGMNIKLEGSDHAPVYTSFGEVPVIPEHSTPSLASRYLPMIRGLQQTLVSVLMKREVAKETKSGEASSSLTTEMTKMERFSESVERSFNNCHELGMPPSDHCSFANQEPKGKLWKTHENHRDLPKDAVCDSTITTGNCKHIHLIPGDRANKKARKNQFSQLSLKSFFQKSPNPRQDVDKLVTDTSLNPADVLESLHDTTPVADYNNCHPELHDVNLSPCSQDQEEQDGKCSLDTEKNNIALLEWKRIQQLMENTIPLCKGHREPCVARVVKKPGPTFGRRFYVCARAEQIVVTLNGLLQNPSTNNNVVSWFASESFILYLVGGILTLYLHRNIPIPPMFSDSNQALTWSRGWFGSFLVGLAVKLGY